MLTKLSCSNMNIHYYMSVFCVQTALKLSMIYTLAPVYKLEGGVRRKGEKVMELGEKNEELER